MASSHTNSDLKQLERIINGLLNKHLQSICATHGLRTSGVKAELQTRIKNALAENLTSDPTSFNHMRNTILNSRGGHTSHANMASPSSSSPGNGYGHTSTHGKPNYSAYSYAGSQIPPQVPGYSNGNASTHKGTSHASHDDLEFKNSPFYDIKSRIGDVRACDAMSQHRNSIHMTIKASEHPGIGDCTYDKSLRIMVLCAGDNQGVQDIIFPHQSEIKVNGGDIKANLRGLKGKPGSTRPVDITDALRLKQYHYTNNVEFTYALTQKVKKRSPSPVAQKFYLAVYLCEMVSVNGLVEKIKGKKIPKASVIRELTKKANDPDIVTTSTKLSLKCPLSYMRLRVPCRSITCNHIQCFDANSYLQLQEQAPQWKCPICNNPAPFDELAVDEYVKDVLENTSDSLEHITIEPDGRWRIQGTESEPKKSRHSGVSSKVEDDDDLSIVSDSRSFGNGAPRSAYTGANAYSTPNRSIYSAGSATGNSREASGAPKSGNKRTAEVIDLTLSSDEDDEPIVRAPKRQYQGPSNGSTLSFPHAPAYPY